MKTLVTGAAGHLGSEITHQLWKQNRNLRVLVRPQANLQGLYEEGEMLSGVEIARGDLLDVESLNNALQGVDVVYQVAGVFETRLEDETPMIRSNVEGTANILKACAKAGVKKVIYTSSVAAIGCSRDPQVRLNESSWNQDPIDAYVASKRDGEREVHRLMKKLSLPVVVLNPGTILGASDYKPTPSNDFIRLYMKSAPPVYFASGHSYTDVEDAARGHLLAEKQGQAGRRYILAGDNVSNQDLFSKIDQIMGQHRFRLKVGHRFVSVVGLGVEALARLRGVKPLFTRAKAHKLIDYYGYFSSARAEEELGYRSRPLDEILLRCQSWFKKRGWI